MSSSNRLGCRESLILGIGLARLEAVVEAAEEAVEQVALCGGVPITGHAAPVATVPTLSTVGLAALVLLLAVVGDVLVRRVSLGA